jgi:hypothetical protein
MSRENGRIRLADVMRHTVFMPSSLWDQMHRIAATFGYRNHSGPKVGQGNVSTLLNAIAEGDLLVCRAEGEHSDRGVDCADR